MQNILRRFVKIRKQENVSILYKERKMLKGTQLMKITRLYTNISISKKMDKLEIKNVR
jgi:hypothetical protein